MRKSSVLIAIIVGVLISSLLPGSLSGIQPAKASPPFFTEHNNCAGAGIDIHWESYHLNRSPEVGPSVTWSDPYSLESATLSVTATWTWPGGNTGSESSGDRTFTEPADCLQTHPIQYSLEVSGGGDCYNFAVQTSASPEGATIVFVPSQSGQWSGRPSVTVTVTASWSDGHVESRNITLTRPTGPECNEPTTPGNPPPSPEVKVTVVESQAAEVKQAPKRAFVPYTCVNEAILESVYNPDSNEWDIHLFKPVFKGSKVVGVEFVKNLTEDAKFNGNFFNPSIAKDACKFAVERHVAGFVIVEIYDFGMNLLGNIPDQYSMPEYRQDDTILIVRGSDNKVLVTDRLRSFERELPEACDFPHSIRVSGEFLTVCVGLDGKLLFMTDNTVVFRSQITGTRPRWSPDGSFIVFQRGTATIRLDFPAAKIQTIARRGGVAMRPDNSGASVTFDPTSVWFSTKFGNTTNADLIKDQIGTHGFDWEGGKLGSKIHEFAFVSFVTQTSGLEKTKITTVRALAQSRSNR